MGRTKFRRFLIYFHKRMTILFFLSFSKIALCYRYQHFVRQQKKTIQYIAETMRQITSIRKPNRLTLVSVIVRLVAHLISSLDTDFCFPLSSTYIFASVVWCVFRWCTKESTVRINQYTANCVVFEYVTSYRSATKVPRDKTACLLSSTSAAKAIIHILIEFLCYSFVI